MSDDSDFAEKILQKKQNSDSDDSDLKCVVESFESKCPLNKQITESTLGTSNILGAQCSLSDVSTQQAINVQILAQLLDINYRLNRIERKEIK